MGKAHVDELGIQAFEIGEEEKLLNRGVIAHVAVEFRVGIASAGYPSAANITVSASLDIISQKSTGASQLSETFVPTRSSAGGFVWAKRVVARTHCEERLHPRKLGIKNPSSPKPAAPFCCGITFFIRVSGAITKV